MKHCINIPLILFALLTSAAPAGEWMTRAATARGRLVIRWSSANTTDATASNAVRACCDHFAPIAGLLGVSETNTERHLEISFSTNLPPNVPASTGNGRIQISAAHAARQPADIAGVVIHEFTHLIQAYPIPKPGWVTEGVADAVRLSLSPAEDPWRRRVESVPRASTDYRRGYGEAARFLLWIRDQGQPDLIRQLNAAMAATRMNDDFWTANTGKSIEDWWSSYVRENPARP